jgi:hypothetical protein
MVEPRPGTPLRARATLDLTPMAFPSDAAVAIEAYHRSSGVRFDCGTVGALRIPDELVLDQIDQGGSVLFRVKVVDSNEAQGKILGSAERIAPRSEEDEEGKRSLFPILYRDLGPELWKVQIDYDDRPKLVLNREIPGIKLKLGDNALIQGLLLPAAFRIVLEALVDDPSEDDDEPGWKADWLKYCAETLGIRTDPSTLDQEGRANWIDDAVAAFCRTYSFMDAIRRMEEDVK